jgi:hypothetical protein
LKSLLLKLIGCSTPDECRTVQSGNTLLRRLGKYSVLFTIAITLFINDFFADLIGNVTGQYETARDSYNSAVTSINDQTSSVLYRWTFGWFFSPPSLPEIPEFDHRVMTLYSILNFLQFAVFICMIAWCLRWIYADCQVTGTSFMKLMMTAAVSNAFLYFFLSFFIRPIFL